MESCMTTNYKAGQKVTHLDEVTILQQGEISIE